MPDLGLLEASWVHPIHGRIVEVICGDHDRELTRSLEFLGIGSTGRRAPRGSGFCLRCTHRGARPANFLPTLAKETPAP
jgi:hypothetical protein